jgi:ParB family chromosome partitioning protein
VANFVRLLDLAEAVQAMVSRGTLSMGHARALLGLPDEQQVQLAEEAVRDRLSVREVEARAQALKSPSTTAPRAAGGKGPRKRPAWVTEIEDTISEAVGATVHVRYGRRRSIIAIECRGREEFERVYELLKAIEPN